MRVTPAMLDQANHEETYPRTDTRYWDQMIERFNELADAKLSEMTAQLHRTTQLLHDILPRLSPADAETMGLVVDVIRENERILGGVK